MSKLNSKQLIAAFELATGKSKKQAAAKANVTPQTLSQWLKIPAFEAKINEYQHECLDEAQMRFKRLAGDAVSSLEDVLRNADSDKAKLDAAKYVIDKLQLIQDGCPAVLTIGETTEEAVVYKKKMDKAHSKQSQMFAENSLMGLSPFMQN